ncbi:MAG: 4-hydroxy-tetrahydrodipicolinate synthase [Bacteroidales bacterium]|jgi:4-hydroxy-tetrahydrodipicolinate synthase|nr:4-hydroxy-tetrahydrodipicolinate synthase [Bacteroidales bacterium]
MIATKLKGTGVALVTPFHKGGNIDFTSLGKVIEHTINGGVDFIVSLGTTGEAATLNEQEQLAVLEYTVETVNERVPVVVGAGNNNTSHGIKKLKKLCEVGGEQIVAVLIVTPYYNKPNQTGLYEHFKSIADMSPKPIIMYNVPGRTGVNLNAETTIRLAEDNSNIIGIKEASGNMIQCMQILKEKPDKFIVFSGDDALTFPLILLGMKGVISVTANAFPDLVSQMTKSALKGEVKAARYIHEKLLSFSNAIFEEGNPTGIKASLEELELVQNNLRLPLVKASRQHYNKLQNLIKEINQKKE